MEEQPFGYIQREKAAILAPWMDKGIAYTAKVIRAPKIRRDVPGMLGVEAEAFIVRCTPILPLEKKTDISAFTSLLNTKHKELETS